MRARALRGLAHQLARPRGVRGRLVGIRLNRRNRDFVTAAVDASELGEGDAAADLGFGGGVGLDLLLRRVGQVGQVHGVELSETMLGQASRRFRRDIAASRLRLHSASISRLPLADDSLDGAITVNTLYFLDELAPAFAELARVIRGSGRVVVGIGDPDSMARIPFTQHGFRLRPVSEVIDALRAAGLVLEDHRRGSQDATAFHLLIARSSRSAT